MTTAVFDTSALLAHLNRETGAEVVEAWLDRGGSAVSALSVQELTKKIAERGGTREDADVTVDDLGLAVHDVTRDLGLDAGAMVSMTVQRHSDLVRGRHEELAHPQLDAVVVSSAAAGFCRSPLRRFSRSR